MDSEQRQYHDQIDTREYSVEEGNPHLREHYATKGLRQRFRRRRGRKDRYLSQGAAASASMP